MVDRADMLKSLFPELGAGGFTRCDGTVAFYGRVNALISSESVVVDLGAGRGRFLEDDVVYRRDLRNLRGRVKEVVGVDVDRVVESNLAVDRSVVFAPGEIIPLDDGSADLIVSDFTFEHVADPEGLSVEILRILRSGGWLCARTPNKWGLIGLPTRIIPNKWHNRILRVLQPSKDERDTFPTSYRLNSRKDIENWFPSSQFEHYSFMFDSEPAYVGKSRGLARLMWTLQKILPQALSSTMLVFVRKR